MQSVDRGGWNCRLQEEPRVDGWVYGWDVWEVVWQNRGGRLHGGQEKGSVFTTNIKLAILQTAFLKRCRDMIWIWSLQLLSMGRKVWWQCTWSHPQMHMFIARYCDLLNVVISCDGCERMAPWHRYRCLQCMDMDLCKTCFLSELTSTLLMWLCYS